MQRARSTLRTHAGRILLGLAMAVALLDAVLAGSALVTQRNTERLSAEVVTLQDSLDQLQQVEREGLEGLASQAQLAESRLEALRAGFPELGEPFDLFRRGFSLAEAHAVEIETIERSGSSLEETPVGYLSVTTYTLKAVSELGNCIAYMRSLEVAGLQTLALENLTLVPEDLRCEFQVIVASAAPAPPASVVEEQDN